MLGASQANTYRFWRGSGQDTIIDFDVTSEQAMESDRDGGGRIAERPDGQPRGGTIWCSASLGRRTGSRLQSHFASVFVRPSFSFSGITVPAYRIEQIQFANGTVWDAATLAQSDPGCHGNRCRRFPCRAIQLDNTILGLGGDDTLYGQEGDDLLDGGAGDDTLFGGTGADTYVFGRGSGHDTVYDDNFNGAEIDTIRLAADVTPGDVTLQADQESGLVLDITGTTDQLTLRFFLEGPFYEIEQMVLCRRHDLGHRRDARTGHRALADGNGEEAVGLSGTVLNDVLEGLGGDDFLDGREGDDTLRGGAGQDELAGRAGADLLEGGEGNGHLLFQSRRRHRHDRGYGGARRRESDGVRRGDCPGPDLALTQSQNVLTIQVGTGGEAIHLMNFDPTGTNGSLVGGDAGLCRRQRGAAGRPARSPPLQKATT
ncbi:MAG: hypothetical protein KatS3mg082_2827 [Nitrospiraceae bacterium]|nr:MAG: hypothetical protein KatS3mg082_2827 [Nitrospiraceae bacterium]